MSPYLRICIVALLTSLFANKLAAQPTPDDKPHPWCWSLNVLVVEEDDGALSVAEAFSEAMEERFDLTGLGIKSGMSAKEVAVGLAENTIDFAVVPFDQVTVSERVRVLWACCDIEEVVTEAEKSGWNSDQVEAFQGLISSPVEATSGYAVLASPRAFEMGYTNRSALFESAFIGASAALE